MGQKSGPAKEPAEQVIREIRRSTRRQFSAEEKHARIELGDLALGAAVGAALEDPNAGAPLCRRQL